MFQEQIKDIYRLVVPFENLYTSVFLMRTNQGNALVDCATYAKDVDEYIVPALNALGLRLTDIKYLILTHQHSDHAGGKTRILELAPSIKIVQTVQEIDLPGITLYEMKGHTLDCIGVLHEDSGTLISGDGLQGKGVGKYRCSLKNKEEYIKTIEKIKHDKRIKNILFSHAYEPWNKDFVFGREEVEKCVFDCKQIVNEKLYISILGDSVSTFEGYSNNVARNTTTQKNKVYYGGKGNTGSDYPIGVEDCWWYKSAHQTGLNILVNNSWSGDKVSKLGQVRCEQLHSDVLNINPDVIAVYLGTNDYNHGLSVEDFYKSYAEMVKKIKKKYQAKVFLFTILSNGLCLEYGRDLTDLPAFNQQIRKVAEQYNCSVVDIYENSGITEENYVQFTFDGTAHLNVQGHELVAKCFINMIKKEIKNESNCNQ